MDSTHPARRTVYDNNPHSARPKGSNRLSLALGLGLGLPIGLIVLFLFIACLVCKLARDTIINQEQFQGRLAHRQRARRHREMVVSGFSDQTIDIPPPQTYHNLALRRVGPTTTANSTPSKCTGLPTSLLVRLGTFKYSVPAKAQIDTPSAPALPAEDVIKQEGINDTICITDADILLSVGDPGMDSSSPRAIFPTHDENPARICQICLDWYEGGDHLMVLPCAHTFHKDCAVAWLREHDTCPFCRVSLPALVENPIDPY